MLIFLDDTRISPRVVHNSDRGLGEGFGKANNWFIVRSYQDFVQAVKDNFDNIQFISFDHDIDSYTKDGSELTGKDAADWLVEYCMDNGKTLPDWFVHSDNTGGNKNIRQLLINYMYRVEGRLSKMDDAYGYFNGQLIYKK